MSSLAILFGIFAGAMVQRCGLNPRQG